MLKKCEKDILNELRNNSRSSIKKISKATDIPITTTFNKIRKLQNSILKYTSLIDFRQISFPLHLIYVLKVKKGYEDDMKSIISTSTYVNNAYRISNGCGYMIECLFKDIEEAYYFEERLRRMINRTFIKHEIIKELKQEEFIFS